MKGWEIIMSVCCPKCEDGFLYVDNDRALKDGTVIHKIKCTKCDCIESFKIKPELYQPQKRIKVTVTKESRLRELEYKLHEAKFDEEKKTYEVIISDMIAQTPALAKWEETKLVDKDCDPILVHKHNDYEKHPVSQKHKKKRGGTIIAIKKYCVKNGKRYGPYPKKGHYFYEVYREGNKIKQRYIGVSHTELPQRVLRIHTLQT